MKFRKGFTLVELLVAVFLFTLLIATALFAHRHIILTIKKKQFHTIEKVLAFNQLKTSIESIQRYIVDDYNQFNKPLKNLHPFFKADKDTILYITQSPIFSNIPSIVELKCDNGDLVYKEEPLYGRNSVISPTLFNDTPSKKYYQELQNCYFKYTKQDKTITNNLNNEIPISIELNIEKENIEESFFVNIKSDYNLSQWSIYELLYMQE